MERGAEGRGEAKVRAFEWGESKGMYVCMSL